METLIYAHFKVDIFRVRLADAIDDRSLAKLLEQAEADFEANDFRGAVDHAAEAYRSASAAWRRLRPDRMSASSVRSQRAGRNEAQAEVAALKSTLQASAFAPDVAEAEWFIKAIAERGDVHDQEDADRAISFAFVWILGFEAAAATWVSDRQHRAALAARLVRNADSATARIVDCIDVSIAHDRIKAVFRIADVPTEAAYSDWARHLSTSLRAETTAHWWVKADGTIEVDRPQDEGDKLQDDARLLAVTLSKAETQLAGEQKAVLARAMRLDARKAEIRQDLLRLRSDWPEWVEDISWSNKSMGGTDERWLITLTRRASRIGSAMARHEADSPDVRAMLLDLPEVTSCYWMGSATLLAVEPVLDPSKLVASLRAIDTAVSRAISDLVMGEDRAEDRRKRILADIRSTIEPE